MTTSQMVTFGLIVGAAIVVATVGCIAIWGADRRRTHEISGDAARTHQPDPGRAAEQAVAEVGRHGEEALRASGRRHPDDTVTRSEAYGRCGG